MIRGGYAGKILRVDLTRGTVADEPLPEERILRKFVGGVGLATKYLYDEVPPTAQPFDPENRLVFMTGPLTSTAFPCSSRYVLATVHAGFKKQVGTTWGGGMWAARLKWSGYDGIIVQGASPTPVYLSIIDGKAELHDAARFWGKDTHQTEDMMAEELGDQDTSTLCIGPGGEALLEFASIQNDHNHRAATCGGGGVMGSKKLKAIAISGSRGAIRVADPKALMELSLAYRKKLIPGGTLQQLLRVGGFLRQYDKLAEGWRLLVKNLYDPAAQVEWADNMVAMVRASKQTPRPCFNCPMACSTDITIGSGPYRGYTVHMSGGAANIEGIGGGIGAMDGGSVLYLVDRADRLGINAAQVGLSLGLLYECYEKGMIGKDFTDGLELNWGNVDAALVLLDKTVKREGLGKTIAEGAKAVAEAIGQGSDQFLGHFKGEGVGHDYRVSWDFVLRAAIASGGGGTIETATSDGWAEDPEMGVKKLLAPFDKDRPPKAMAVGQPKNRWDNSVGLCLFAQYGVEGAVDDTVKALNYATGWDFTREEALTLGKRVVAVMRTFNLRRGLTKADDLDIGARFLDDAGVGPFKGHPARPHIERWVGEYYSNMGWDPKTGIPTEETLKSLDLNELVEDARKLRKGKTPVAARKKK